MDMNKTWLCFSNEHESLKMANFKRHLQEVSKIYSLFYELPVCSADINMPSHLGTSLSEGLLWPLDGSAAP